MAKNFLLKFCKFRVRTIIWTRISIILGAALCANSLRALAPAHDAGLMTVQLRTMTPHIAAYARVEPIAALPVSAAESGIVSDLRVLPGMHVRAGQELAHLNGPAINALLLQGEANVRAAQSQLHAAQKTLAIQRQQLLSHLTTRDMLHQAESTEAQAQTGLDNAESRLKAVRQMRTLSAPTDAIVLSLSSADDALVAPGQTILTLQSATGLWLKAEYYGAEMTAIRTGMTGIFSPADGSGPIPVKVSAVFGSLTSDGGVSVTMAPVERHVQWLNGQSGTVALNAPPRKLIAVPTRALILDQGKWWVMVHTAHGDHPQVVVPGNAQGWDTFIEQGIQPGTQIIVENAYLLFHSTISRSYQIPE